MILGNRAVMSFLADLLDHSAQADQALQLYYAQLGLNLIWSPLFFGFKQKEIALGNLLALTGTVAAMTVSATKCIPSFYITS